MFARARELQAQREAERQEQLRELEMKRFRQQSDLLRSRESQMRVLAATNGRGEQLDEKDRIAAQLVRVCVVCACVCVRMRRCGTGDCRPHVSGSVFVALLLMIELVYFCAGSILERRDRAAPLS
jgi:uncharacterized Fe-S radical SAM superfamily protein PflX